MRTPFRDHDFELRSNGRWLSRFFRKAKKRCRQSDFAFGETLGRGYF